MSNTHTGQVTGATTVTTTTETVVVVVPTFQTNNPGGTGVTVDGMCELVTGTGATTVSGKLYRAGAIAPVVGSAVPAGATQIGNTLPVTDFTAGQTTQLVLDAEDTSATALTSGVAGVAYFATVTQTGASANGSVTFAILNANSATATE